MANETETPDGSETADEPPPDDELRTSGYVERTILHHMAGDDRDRSVPTTVSDVVDVVAAVIERGGYGNVGPSGTAGAAVRKSSVRRTFTQLRDKGLVERVSALDGAELRDARYALGTPDGDPEDPASYPATTDDARVTDWVLADAGRREVARLDARYAAELDELAARYGRPRGETTTRVDA